MGRKKLYDPLKAIEAIKHVFWLQGYEGTSMQDIEDASGLPRQSLYREFGDKQAIYLAALRDYDRVEINLTRRTLSTAGDARHAFDQLFEGVIEQVETAGDLRGCFLCNASADRTQLSEPVNLLVRRMTEQLRHAFLMPLGKQGYPSDLADTLLAGYIGLRILVRSGHSVPQLRQISDRLLGLLENTPPARA